jgi:hypothetical protein
MLTLKKAIAIALSLAESSHLRGCLYKQSIDEETNDHDWSKGDPETFDTIYLLTINDGEVEDADEDSAEAAIYAALHAKFPYVPDAPEHLEVDALATYLAESDTADLLKIILSNPDLLSDEAKLELVRNRNLELATTSSEDE